jgi:hypothetical protein
MTGFGRGTGRGDRVCVPNSTQWYQFVCRCPELGSVSPKLGCCSYHSGCRSGIYAAGRVKKAAEFIIGVSPPHGIHDVRTNRVAWMGALPPFLMPFLSWSLKNTNGWKLPSTTWNTVSLCFRQMPNPSISGIWTLSHRGNLMRIGRVRHTGGRKVSKGFDREGL